MQQPHSADGVSCKKTESDSPAEVDTDDGNPKGYYEYLKNVNVIDTTESSVPCIRVAFKGRLEQVKRTSSIV
jgi:hypothetical protein